MVTGNGRKNYRKISIVSIFSVSMSYLTKIDRKLKGKENLQSDFGENGSSQIERKKIRK